jgi:hypothetical protein
LEALFMLIPAWLLRIASKYLDRSAVCSKAQHAYAYPSPASCFSFEGTSLCHHFQSSLSLAKRLPDLASTSVESC